MEGRVEGRLGEERVAVLEGGLQEGLREMKRLTDEFLTRKLTGSAEAEPAKPVSSDSEAEEA